MHRWQPADDGTIVTGNRVSRIAARARRHRAVRQRHQCLPRRQRHRLEQHRQRLRLLGDPRQQREQHPDRRQHLLASGETGIYSEFAFEGAVINGNLVDGAANGISIVNFNEGGRMAVCSANIVRNLRRKGPYEQDPPVFGVGISVEADCSATGNVVENAPLYGMQIGWGELHAQCRGDRQRHPQGGHRHRRHGRRRRGLGGDLRQFIHDVSDGAIVGYRWADPATGDLAVKGAGGHANLTIERNRVS